MSREEHIQSFGCCATCICWVVNAGGVGDCWSGDRLDDDFTKGPAGTTFAYDICEAHCPRGPDPDFLRTIENHQATESGHSGSYVR